MEIRYAKKSDARTLWEMRNCKAIREVSTNTARIPYENHLKWFAEAIKQNDTLLFIIKDNVGSVRIDRIEDVGVVSIYLLPKAQGKGLGVKSLNLAVRLAFEKWDIKKIKAFIREDNENSIKAFQKVGFTRNNRAIGVPKDHLQFEVV